MLKTLKFSRRPSVFLFAAIALASLTPTEQARAADTHSSRLQTEDLSAGQLQETIVRPTAQKTSTAQKLKTSAAQKMNYEITPYVWLTHVDSSMKGQGVELPLKLTPSDVIEATETGIAFVAKVKKGQSVMSAEVYYQDAAGYNTKLLTPIGAIPVVIDSEAIILEIWMGERFGEGNDWVEFYIGARDFKSTNDVLVANSIQQQSKLEWTEMLIAQHSNIQLTDRISIFSRGSLGNLDGDDFSYDAMIGTNIQMSKRISLSVGYRAQQFVYEKENKSDRIDSLITKNRGPIISIHVKL